MNKKVDILRDITSFTKFCAKNDKAFGCKKAFGCYLSCPLWLARESQFLSNEKGMTIGEAHRACLRAYITPEDEHDIIKDAVTGAASSKPEYIVLQRRGKIEDNQ